MNFKDRPVDVRRDHHRRPPTMPMPWGQKSI
jgi:creatinine amidohydrolase